MNILHISTAQSWRGGERQVKFLLDGLKNKDIEVHLMTPHNSALSQRCGLKESSILVYNKGIFSIWKNIRSLTKYCARKKIDIIHGHDSHAHSLLWLAYRFGGLTVKSVVTRRLLNPVKARSLNKYNHPKIEKIICISRAVKNSIAPSILNPDRLEVIHSGIDLQTVSSLKKSSEKKKIVVGYVAAFTEEKDHETFVATANLLMKYNPEYEYQFLLVGDGPTKSRIMEKTAKFHEKFSFTGFVKHVESEYDKMDVLLHTCQSEALGTSILDAMKYGVPVVAANSGGIPEIIDDGINGFLCTPGDEQQFAGKVHQLGIASVLKDKVSHQAIQSLNQFDISEMIDKTVVLYGKI
ncbi:MAG: glycosyltransferase family 4 protein [Bacteroidota bacterium]